MTPGAGRRRGAAGRVGALLAAGAAVVSAPIQVQGAGGVPDPGAVLGIDRYLQIRGHWGAAISPDGSEVAYLDRTTGLPAVWAVPATGGWPRQITFFDEAVGRVDWSPAAGGPLIVERDIGGNERDQLLLIDPNGEHATRLTGDDNAIHHLGGWSPDGRAVSYRSNRRNPAYFDIYLLDLETGEARVVLEQDGTNTPGDFSPDGRELFAFRLIGPDENEPYVLDVASGKTRKLVPGQPPARYLAPRWSADGRSAYVITDRGRDFLNLARLDLDSGRITFLRDDPYDVEEFEVAGDRRTAALVLNVDGFSELHLIDLETGAELESPRLPRGVILDLDWAPDGKRLALTVSTARSPGTVLVLDRAAGVVDEATHPVLAGISPGSFVEPEVIRYPSFDGRIITGLFYTPAGDAAIAGTPPPCVVTAHGGPTSQSRASFSVLSQYFVSRGAAVFLPNVRGSTGYGRAFMQLDDGEHREDSVADLERGVARLGRQGRIDTTRVAVRGQSYGGYMVLAALTLYPERWAAGVDIVGIANFVSFLERTGAYRRRHREAEYGSLDRNRALLERISPLGRVDRIRAPLLVIHGANDPRVPVEEAEQIVEALRARQQPVAYLRFEDEGHGITRLENRLEAYGAMARFLAAHLGLRPEPPAGAPRPRQAATVAGDGIE